MRIPISISTLFLSVFLFLSVAAIPLQGGDDRLCVQTHYGHENWEPLSTIEQIRDLGVGWIRDDLYWNTVEKIKGEYKIPEYAWNWLKAAKANNLKVILILNGSNGNCYEDPFDQEGYVNFAKFVASEVRGYANALELVNEPFNHYRMKVPGRTEENSHWNGWNPETGETDYWVIKYHDLLGAAAEAIHATAPGEYKIIGLGCSLPVNVRLLQMGISPCVDGIALHPYAYRYVPELQPYGDTPAFLERDGVVLGDYAGTSASIYLDLIATSQRYHGPKELWLTEVGYTSYIPTRPARYGGFTEEAQAKYAQRHFMESLGLGVNLTSWYTFYSRQNSPYSNLGNFGLVRFDGTPKPAYHAIRRLTSVMRSYQAEAWGTVRVHFRQLRHFTQCPDPHPLIWDGSLRATFGTPRAYTFVSTDRVKRMVAIWSTERAGGDLQPRLADLAVITDRKVTSVIAHDLYTSEEKPLTFQQQGQLLRLDNVTVPDHPVLLIMEGLEPVPDAAPASQTIFDNSDAWTIDCVNNTQGTWSTANNIGILRVNEINSRYLGVKRLFAVTPDAPCLSLRVRATTNATLLVRLRNESGMIRQFKRSLSPSNQWENIHINPLQDVYQQWGSSEDENPILPAVELFLGVENPDQVGTIEFTDLLLLAE